jgi:hypothetical protein
MKLLFACLLIASCMYATYAACSGKDDCYECLRAVPNDDDSLCGWCAEDLSCYAGTAEGPGGFSTNCTSEWYWDTCSGDDCAENDGDCASCIDNPLCGYCTGDNTCIELQGEGTCAGTDTFATYDCGTLGQRCDAGQVDNDGECIDCPPYGNEDNQSSNACNFVGYCKVNGDGDSFCKCKPGYDGASCQYITKQGDNEGTLVSGNVANGATGSLNPGSTSNAFVTTASVTNNSGGSVSCFLLALEIAEDGDIVNPNQYAPPTEAEDELDGETFSGYSGFDFSCVDGQNREVDIDDLDITVTIDAGAQGLTCDEIVVGKYDTENNEWINIREECGEPSGTTTCVFDICHFSQYQILQGAGDETTTEDFTSTAFSFSTASSSTTSAATAVQPAVALAFAALVGAFFF